MITFYYIALATWALTVLALGVLLRAQRRALQVWGPDWRTVPPGLRVCVENDLGERIFMPYWRDGERLMGRPVVRLWPRSAS